jgi:glutaconyl-CoA/methylmalonyl-CoA decarboxylase subunit gamma
LETTSLGTASPTDPAPPSSGSSPAPSEGTPVMPPMPGRVIEVRVSEGQRVEAGSILLVVEAMKMRNEVASPVAGFVRGLRVAAGSNVRSHEPMLYVAPP